MVNPFRRNQNPGMTMDLKKYIGVKIRLGRKRLELSQPELAEKVDLATETVSNIERGIYYTKIETLERLSDFLDIPMRDFFEEVNVRDVSLNRLERESILQNFSQTITDSELQITLDLVKSLKENRS